MLLKKKNCQWEPARTVKLPSNRDTGAPKALKLYPGPGKYMCLCMCIYVYISSTVLTHYVTHTKVKQEAKTPKKGACCAVSHEKHRLHQPKKSTSARAFSRHGPRGATRTTHTISPSWITPPYQSESGSNLLVRCTHITQYYVFPNA